MLLSKLSGRERQKADDPLLVSSLGREDALEEGMASHSSILAGETPWTEEPGRLQSIGSQRWTQLKELSTHVCSGYYKKQGNL